MKTNNDCHCCDKHNASVIAATAQNRYRCETAKLHGVCSIIGNYETIWKVFDKARTGRYVLARHSFNMIFILLFILSAPKNIYIYDVILLKIWELECKKSKIINREKGIPFSSKQNKTSCRLRILCCYCCLAVTATHLRMIDTGVTLICSSCRSEIKVHF